MISQEELRLGSMIENAKKSTWDENLRNAVEAHERFMLPNRPHETSDVARSIDQQQKQILLHLQQRRVSEEAEVDKFYK